MRFHSTQESVDNGEITLLAIIECLVAVAIYVFVAIHFQTFRYLAVAVCLAPLTLFRTDASVRWGITKYKQISYFGEKLSSFWGMFFIACVVALAGVLIRVTSMLLWAIRSPLDTLKSVPQNWLRQSFCTDLFYPVEFVPGERTMPREVPTFETLFLFLERDKKWSKRLGFIFLLSPFLCLGYLPSLFYRLSFKATSLAYAPFVWVARATLGSGDSVKLRLTQITKGELEKTRRWLSGLVAAALAAKFALSRGWVDVAAVLAKFPSKRFVESLLVPHVWPWWVVTLGIDALLTFSLLYYADAALARLEDQHAWREETVATVVSSVSFLRASLSIITMSHFFAVAFSTVVASRVPFLSGTNP